MYKYTVSYQIKSYPSHWYWATPVPAKPSIPDSISPTSKPPLTWAPSYCHEADYWDKSFFLNTQPSKITEDRRHWILALFTSAARLPCSSYPCWKKCFTDVTFQWCENDRYFTATNKPDVIFKMHVCCNDSSGCAERPSLNFKAKWMLQQHAQGRGKTRLQMHHSWFLLMLPGFSSCQKCLFTALVLWSIHMPEIQPLERGNGGSFGSFAPVVELRFRFKNLIAGKEAPKFFTSIKLECI